MKQLLFFLLGFVTFLAAMEEVTIYKTITFEECRKYEKLLDSAGYGWQQRKSKLKKWAQKFDAQQDGELMRKIVVADKNNNAYYKYQKNSSPSIQLVRIRPPQPESAITFGKYYTDTSDQNHYTYYYPQRLSFIDKAVRNNNIPFLEALFALFPPNEADPIEEVVDNNPLIFLTELLGYRFPLLRPFIEIEPTLVRKYKASTMLAVDTKDAVCKSKEITEFVFNNSYFQGPKRIKYVDAEKPGYNYFWEKYEEARKKKKVNLKKFSIEELKSILNDQKEGKK